MNRIFDHEKLEVYQRSINFVGWTSEILDGLPKSSPVRDQLDRASMSIPLNLAEGNGKWTSKDRCRYFDSARGSSLECAAALDVASAKGFVDRCMAREGKEQLVEIVRMLVGLIKANDPEREFGKQTEVAEDGVRYEAPDYEDQDQD